MKRGRKQDIEDERETHQVKSARKTDVPRKRDRALETSQTQKLKRKQRSEEDGDNSHEDTIDPREYRTAKRRRETTEQDSESSLSSQSSDSNESDEDSSDPTSWSSWESDNGSSTERSEQKPTTAVDRTKEKVINREKLRKEEAAVIGDLDHFWSSQVAAKARKEFGSLKPYLGQSFSLDTLKQRSNDVEKLMSLPCVVSVGFNKENSKFTVTVSDRKKALELSEELSSSNVNLVEVRSSHLV